MKYNKKLLSISVIMLYMIKLWAQPMAHLDDELNPFNNDVLTAEYHLDDVVTEDYLSSLIWKNELRSPNQSIENSYAHIVDFLENLEREKGHEPFFFDAYYHPLAQQMSGFTFGRAGVPIATFDTLSSGDIEVSLSTETPKAIIHYTTDGTTPDELSSIWNDDVVIDENMILRAKTIRSDLEHSPVLEIGDQRLRLLLAEEELNEDKIMGIFPIPGTDELIIKYKTKAQGFISITLIDDQRQSYYVDEILAMKAQFGLYRIPTSDIVDGAYLIKFQFDSGKTMYRQMMKEVD